MTANYRQKMVVILALILKHALALWVVSEGGIMKLDVFEKSTCP